MDAAARADLTGRAAVNVVVFVAGVSCHDFVAVKRKTLHVFVFPFHRVANHYTSVSLKISYCSSLHWGPVLLQHVPELCCSIWCSQAGALDMCAVLMQACSTARTPE